MKRLILIGALIVVALFLIRAIGPAAILSGILGILAIVERILSIRALRKFNETSNSENKNSKKMTYEEALEILELPKNPSKSELKEAYHRMIQKCHPDVGGSTYLASKINEAKKIIEENNSK